MAKPLDKDEVKKIVDDEIEKFIDDSLDKEMKGILHNSNSQSRAEIITIIRNAMESVYKTLWFKKDFWYSNIK